MVEQSCDLRVMNVDGQGSSMLPISIQSNLGRSGLPTVSFLLCVPSSATPPSVVSRRDLGGLDGLGALRQP